mmetsp:Transcript_60960/g.137861  ORF Transcript_60960/g.137861 Transcript_60960/m.137861 type:complete len:287 (+) Transcript_60960:716-1576(+)
MPPPWCERVNPLRALAWGQRAATCKAWFASSPTCHVQDLALGRDSLEDTAVLHLEQGSDYFIFCKGAYARSCFGAGLDELASCAAEQPIRQVPIALTPDGQRRFLANPNATGPTLSVPKELWRLVDAIYQRGGMRERHLFLTLGNPTEVERIRECLDTGVGFEPSWSVHSLAETLLAFLQSLAEPVIPPHLLPKVEVDAQNMTPWSRRLLELLPPLNYNTLVYMISFFRELLLHSDSNRLTAAKVADLCCTCMTAGGPDGDFEGRPPQGKQNLRLVIYHFLTAAMI